ncbi:DctP family TRAP transporter solute-binding subunit [Brevibacterium moorei]|uniref:DctP family TRAP transporter solute-binding subunit n=1 Tax=Brevibacterium moorei TaxID=2968457 RepID=UPI00211C4F1B|nr:DctP family TRAP transporter solute-binding subunit [Brevibacterium sp. 68QC2CO]MCQ9385443.1 DctP family TRAP transporter solute-binding subunit [Brevibacterium sp. 68QC2CO]
MRRRLATAAAACLSALALTLSGCGLMDPVDISGFAKDAPDPDAKVIRLANVYESKHPSNRCGTATMKKELATKGIDLQVYPSSQLGTEAEIVEQVATGALDIGISSGAFFGVWYPDSAVVDAPYLFTSADEYDQGTRGKTLEKVYDDMAAETGLHVFSSWYYGARHVTANKPVRNPDDFKGLKIRTPDAPLYLQMINAFGGTATPMALTEVYLALQQHAIDAEENPIPTVSSNKFEEVQSTISLTGHIVQGIQLVTSDHFLDGLEPADRDAVMHAADSARRANLQCVKDEERDILANWKSDDTIKVVEDVDVDGFRDRIKDQMLPKTPYQQLYLDIQKEVAGMPAGKASQGGEK